MNCPECGSICWRNEVDVGVGVMHDGWKCSSCSWDEDVNSYPMTKENWEEWLKVE